MLFPTLAAGRLHLDTLWNTASAATSEREIYCRTPCVRSSRRPSLPQVSRSYDLPPPYASTRSLQMPAKPPPFSRRCRPWHPRVSGTLQRRPSCASIPFSPLPSLSPVLTLQDSPPGVLSCDSWVH